MSWTTHSCRQFTAFGVSINKYVYDADGTEYNSVKERFSHEFFTRLPPEADISKVKVERKRDFNKPGSKERKTRLQNITKFEYNN